jgi:trehalose utilization protein
MNRPLCQVCTLAGIVAAFGILSTVLSDIPPVHAKEKIRVLVWSERTEPVEIYPKGINGAFLDFLGEEKNITARTANIGDPDQGITDEVLQNTDVLVWFGHRKHADVSETANGLILKHVRERGMGYLPIHSSHYAKAFQRILQDIAAERGKPLEGTPGKWGLVKNEGKPETIHVLTPGHPIAKGVQDFTIPKTETYGNPFNAPEPDLKILEGRYEGGPQDGSDGLLYQYGKGKVFYFRPGHETYPIYFQKEVQQILKNAIRYLGSDGPVKPRS